VKQKRVARHLAMSTAVVVATVARTAKVVSLVRTESLARRVKVEKSERA
jgi:hypothetical protein